MKKIITFAAAAALAIGTAFMPVDISEKQADAAESGHVVAATEQVSGLSPYAWYKFDDEETLGKDRMGRFDLEKMVYGSGAYEIRTEADKGFDYIAIRRNKDVMDVDPGDGVKYRQTNPMNGVLFYAPNLDKSGYDMSDLIKSSYTLSITFRAYVPDDFGAAQLVCTGRYSDSTCITPWQTGVTVTPATRWMLGKEASQPEIDAWRKPVTLNRLEWNTLTLVGDAEQGKVSCYVNGVLAQSWEIDPVRFTNQNMEGALGADYTFAIGGSISRDGTGLEQCCDADIKECMIFDYAVSAQNVADLYSGAASVEYSGVTVESVPEINDSAIDLQLTDRNTLKDVMKKMPSSATVTLSDGGKEKANIFWTTGGSDNTLYGILQPMTGANTKGYTYRYKCDYVLKFDYDKAHATLSDVKLGKNAKDPDVVNVLDDAEALSSKSLSFKLEVAEGYHVESVNYDGTDWFFADDWAGDDEGYVYLNVRYGAEIKIVVIDDSQTPVTPDTPGNGEADNGKEPEEKKGCGSFLTFGAASLFGAVAAATCAVGMKKRKNK